MNQRLLVLTFVVLAVALVAGSLMLYQAWPVLCDLARTILTDEPAEEYHRCQ